MNFKDFFKEFRIQLDESNDYEKTLKHFLPIQRIPNTNEEREIEEKHLEYLSCSISPVLKTSYAVKFIRNLPFSPGSHEKCSTIWSGEEMVYRCRTCALSESSFICSTCFREGDHKGHDYFIYKSVNKGSCDCGEPESWKRSGFCKTHQGLNPPIDPSLLLPFITELRCRILFSLVIRRLFYIMVYCCVQKRIRKTGMALTMSYCRWIINMCNLHDGIRRLFILCLLDAPGRLPHLDGYCRIRAAIELLKRFTPIAKGTLFCPQEGITLMDFGFAPPYRRERTTQKILYDNPTLASHRKPFNNSCIPKMEYTSFGELLLWLSPLVETQVNCSLNTLLLHALNDKFFKECFALILCRNYKYMIQQMDPLSLYLNYKVLIVKDLTLNLCVHHRLYHYIFAAAIDLLMDSKVITECGVVQINSEDEFFLRVSSKFTCIEDVFIAIENEVILSTSLKKEEVRTQLWDNGLIKILALLQYISPKRRVINDEANLHLSKESPSMHLISSVYDVLYPIMTSVSNMLLQEYYPNKYKKSYGVDIPIEIVIQISESMLGALWRQTREWLTPIMDNTIASSDYYGGIFNTIPLVANKTNIYTHQNIAWEAFSPIINNFFPSKKHIGDNIPLIRVCCGFLLELLRVDSQLRRNTALLPASTTKSIINNKNLKYVNDVLFELNICDNSQKYAMGMVEMSLRSVAFFLQYTTSNVWLSKTMPTISMFKEDTWKGIYGLTDLTVLQLGMNMVPTPTFLATAISRFELNQSLFPHSDSPFSKQNQANPFFCLFLTLNHLISLRSRLTLTQYETAEQTIRDALCFKPLTRSEITDLFPKSESCMVSDILISVADYNEPTMTQEGLYQPKSNCWFLVDPTSGDLNINRSQTIEKKQFSYLKGRGLSPNALHPAVVYKKSQYPIPLTMLKYSMRDLISSAYFSALAMTALFNYAALKDLMDARNSMLMLSLISKILKWEFVYLAQCLEEDYREIIVNDDIEYNVTNSEWIQLENEEVKQERRVKFYAENDNLFFNDVSSHITVIRECNIPSFAPYMHPNSLAKSLLKPFAIVPASDICNSKSCRVSHAIYTGTSSIEEVMGKEFYHKMNTNTNLNSTDLRDFLHFNENDSDKIQDTVMETVSYTVLSGLEILRAISKAKNCNSQYADMAIDSYEWITKLLPCTDHCNKHRSENPCLLESSSACSAPSLIGNTLHTIQNDVRALEKHKDEVQGTFIASTSEAEKYSQDISLRGYCSESSKNKRVLDMSSSVSHIVTASADSFTSSLTPKIEDEINSRSSRNSANCLRDSCIICQGKESFENTKEITGYTMCSLYYITLTGSGSCSRPRSINTVMRCIFNLAEASENEACKYFRKPESLTGNYQNRLEMSALDFEFSTERDFFRTQVLQTDNRQHIDVPENMDEYNSQSFNTSFMLRSCGHKIHYSCYLQLSNQSKDLFLQCPLCSQSVTCIIPTVSALKRLTTIDIMQGHNHGDKELLTATGSKSLVEGAITKAKKENIYNSSTSKYKDSSLALKRRYIWQCNMLGVSSFDDFYKDIGRISEILAFRSYENHFFLFLDKMLTGEPQNVIDIFSPEFIERFPWVRPTATLITALKISHKRDSNGVNPNHLVDKPLTSPILLISKLFADAIQQWDLATRVTYHYQSELEPLPEELQSYNYSTMDMPKLEQLLNILMLYDKTAAESKNYFPWKDLGDSFVSNAAAYQDSFDKEYPGEFGINMEDLIEDRSFKSRSTLSFMDINTMFVEARLLFYHKITEQLTERMMSYRLNKASLRDMMFQERKYTISNSLLNDGLWSPSLRWETLTTLLLCERSNSISSEAVNTYRLSFYLLEIIAAIWYIWDDIDDFFGMLPEDCHTPLKRGYIDKESKLSLSVYYWRRMLHSRLTYRENSTEFGGHFKKSHSKKDDVILPSAVSQFVSESDNMGIDAEFSQSQLNEDDSDCETNLSQTSSSEDNDARYLKEKNERWLNKCVWKTNFSDFFPLYSSTDVVNRKKIPKSVRKWRRQWFLRKGLKAVSSSQYEPLELIMAKLSNSSETESYLDWNSDTEEHYSSSNSNETMSTTCEDPGYINNENQLSQAANDTTSAISYANNSPLLSPGLNSSSNWEQLQETSFADLSAISLEGNALGVINAILPSSHHSQQFFNANGSSASTSLPYNALGPYGRSRALCERYASLSSPEMWKIGVFSFSEDKSIDRRNAILTSVHLSVLPFARKLFFTQHCLSIPSPFVKGQHLISSLHEKVILEATMLIERNSNVANKKITLLEYECQILHHLLRLPQIGDILFSFNDNQKSLLCKNQLSKEQLQLVCESLTKDTSKWGMISLSLQDFEGTLDGPMDLFSRFLNHSASVPICPLTTYISAQADSALFSSVKAEYSHNKYNDMSEEDITTRQLSAKNFTLPSSFTYINEYSDKIEDEGAELATNAIKRIIHPRSNENDAVHTLSHLENNLKRKHSSLGNEDHFLPPSKKEKNDDEKCNEEKSKQEASSDTEDCEMHGIKQQPDLIISYCNSGHTVDDDIWSDMMQCETTIQTVIEKDIKLLQNIYSLTNSSLYENNYSNSISITIKAKRSGSDIATSFSLQIPKTEHYQEPVFSKKTLRSKPFCSIMLGHPMISRLNQKMRDTKNLVLPLNTSTVGTLSDPKASSLLSEKFADNYYVWKKQCLTEKIQRLSRKLENVSSSLDTDPLVWELQKLRLERMSFENADEGWRSLSTYWESRQSEDVPLHGAFVNVSSSLMKEKENYIMPTIEIEINSLGFSPITNPFQTLYMNYYNYIHPHRDYEGKNKECTAICLICNTIVCGGVCCNDQYGQLHTEFIKHAAKCSHGKGLFLHLKANSIYAIRKSMCCKIGAIHLDPYGETDRNLERDGLLMLHSTRVRNLLAHWITGRNEGEMYDWAVWETNIQGR